MVPFDWKGSILLPNRNYISIKTSDNFFYFITILFDNLTFISVFSINKSIQSILALRTVKIGTAPSLALTAIQNYVNMTVCRYRYTSYHDFKSLHCKNSINWILEVKKVDFWNVLKILRSTLWLVWRKSVKVVELDIKVLNFSHMYILQWVYV